MVIAILMKTKPSAFDFEVDGRLWVCQNVILQINGLFTGSMGYLQDLVTLSIGWLSSLWEIYLDACDWDD